MQKVNNQLMLLQIEESRTKMPRTKEKIQRTKFQRKHKIQNFQGFPTSGEPLEFYIWNFFGSWFFGS